MHPLSHDWKRWSFAERILAISLVAVAVLAPITPFLVSL
jgi:hypothetical protein